MLRGLSEAAWCIERPWKACKGMEVTLRTLLADLATQMQCPPEETQTARLLRNQKLQTVASRGTTPLLTSAGD